MLGHDRENILDTQEHTDHVDVEQPPEGISVVLTNRGDNAFDSGVGGQHIYTAKAFQSLAHILFGIFL